MFVSLLIMRTMFQPNGAVIGLLTFIILAAGAVLISIPIAILFLDMQRYYVDGVSGAVKG